MDKEINEITRQLNVIVERFSKDPARWHAIRQILEADIKDLEALIELIDHAILTTENKLTKLN